MAEANVTLYYSYTTHGFYNSIIHTGDKLPDDVIVITEDEHKALFDGQSKGLTITRPDPSGNGKPILVDNRQTPEQMLLFKMRMFRDTLLRITVDKMTAIRLTTITSDEQSQVMAYRESLLNVPQQSGFPDTITWPTVPACLVTPQVTALMSEIANTNINTVSTYTL
jgi:hypothetical protein